MSASEATYRDNYLRTDCQTINDHVSRPVDLIGINARDVDVSHGQFEERSARRARNVTLPYPYQSRGFNLSAQPEKAKLE
ncbi:hypothetical protein AB4097_07405 [Microvirga sp. 2MCAF35]|uniref:hypothetical protein n=1 Tax=Microvirga sp. 2MCAF35 TaxID=3232987 RepID=UPI003F9AC774